MDGYCQCFSYLKVQRRNILFWRRTLDLPKAFNIQSVEWQQKIHRLYHRSPWSDHNQRWKLERTALSLSELACTECTGDSCRSESELVSFNCDGLSRISLEQVCGWQEPDFNARYQTSWTLVIQRLPMVSCIAHNTLAFNLQSFWNALQLIEGTRSDVWSNKVFAIQGNWIACAGVPNNRECCSLR